MINSVSKVEFHPNGFITNVYTSDGRIISFQKALREQEEGVLHGLEDSNASAIMGGMMLE